MADTPVSSRLHVLQAVEDGWNAFTKAPWPFVLFSLLVGVLSNVAFELGLAGRRAPPQLLRVFASRGDVARVVPAGRS